jgi:hypothetical protein
MNLSWLGLVDFRASLVVSWSGVVLRRDFSADFEIGLRGRFKEPFLVPCAPLVLLDIFTNPPFSRKIPYDVEPTAANFCSESHRKVGHLVLAQGITGPRVDCNDVVLCMAIRTAYAIEVEEVLAEECGRHFLRVVADAHPCLR